VIREQRVQELLARWRAAERELEQTNDPGKAAELNARIAEIRAEYRGAIDAAAMRADDEHGYDGARL
jgi:hypothetical protein